MIAVILIILILLWFFGYISPAGFLPNISLFNINGRDISLWDLLIFLLVVWVISVLPEPFGWIAGILLLLWLLSTLGILAVVGLPSILVILIIAAILIAFVTGL